MQMANICQMCYTTLPNQENLPHNFVPLRLSRRGCRIQIQHEQSSSDFSNLATFVAAGASNVFGFWGKKQLILEATNDILSHWNRIFSKFWWLIFFGVRKYFSNEKLF